MDPEDSSYLTFPRDVMKGSFLQLSDLVVCNWLHCNGIVIFKRENPSSLRKCRQVLQLLCQFIGVKLQDFGEQGQPESC